MRKQFFFEQDGKTTSTLGFTGRIKQIFINSYVPQKQVKKEIKDSTGTQITKMVDSCYQVGNLSDTILDLTIGGLKLLEDYRGCPVDDFNILLEEFEVDDNTSIELKILKSKKNSDEALKPVVVTFIYELPERQKRTILK